MPQADDLLTYTEVREASLEASSAVDDEPTAVLRAIRDVQSDIADWLSFDPIVHKTTDLIPRKEWREDDSAPGDATEWVAWADEQPVVQVTTPSDVGVYFDDRRLTHDRADNLRVTYFSGWKRADQTGGEQQARLTNLTTEPPALPSAIRRVAIKLVLYELNALEHGAGVQNVEQSVGQAGTFTLSGIDSGFRERQLERISDFRVTQF